MTRVINIGGQSFRITVTDHFIQRTKERQIPVDKILSTIITVVNNNQYSKQYKKYLLKNLQYNFSLVINTKKTNHFKLITAINNITCHDPSAKIITVK